MTEHRSVAANGTHRGGVVFPRFLDSSRRHLRPDCRLLRVVVEVHGR